MNKFVVCSYTPRFSESVNDCGCPVNVWLLKRRILVYYLTSMCYAGMAEKVKFIAVLPPTLGFQSTVENCEIFENSSKYISTYEW